MRRESDRVLRIVAAPGWYSNTIVACPWLHKAEMITIEQAVRNEASAIVRNLIRAPIPGVRLGAELVTRSPGSSGRRQSGPAKSRDFPYEPQTTYGARRNCCVKYLELFCTSVLSLQIVCVERAKGCCTQKRTGQIEELRPRSCWAWRRSYDRFFPPKASTRHQLSRRPFASPLRTRQFSELLARVAASSSSFLASAASIGLHHTILRPPFLTAQSQPIRPSVPGSSGMRPAPHTPTTESYLLRRTIACFV